VSVRPIYGKKRWGQYYQLAPSIKNVTSILPNLFPAATEKHRILIKLVDRISILSAIEFPAKHEFSIA